MREQDEGGVLEGELIGFQDYGIAGPFDAEGSARAVEVRWGEGGGNVTAGVNVAAGVAVTAFDMRNGKLDVVGVTSTVYVS